MVVCKYSSLENMTKDNQIHTCDKIGQISKMEERLNIVHKKVMGNGEEGLDKAVTRLQENIKTTGDNIFNLNNTIESFRTAISAIEKSYVSMETIARDNERYLQNRKWNIRTIIALCSLLLTCIGFLFFKK